MSHQQHNQIFAEPVNQLPQKENKQALFVHHSGVLTQKMMMNQLLQAGFDVEIINISEEVKKINSDREILEKEKAIMDILTNVQKEVEEYLKKTKIDLCMIEANLGFPGATQPTCFGIIGEISNKNPEVIRTIITNTNDCVVNTLRDSYGEKVYYLGIEKVEQLSGRIFTKLSDLLFHLNQTDTLKPPASPLNRETSTLSAGVVDVVESPKSPGSNQGSSPGYFSDVIYAPAATPSSANTTSTSTKNNSFKTILKRLAACWCPFKANPKTDKQVSKNQITVTPNTLPQDGTGNETKDKRFNL